MSLETSLVISSSSSAPPRPSVAHSNFRSLPEFPYDPTILYDGLPYADPPVNDSSAIAALIHAEAARSTRSPRELLEAKLRSIGIPLESPDFLSRAPLMAASVAEISRSGGSIPTGAAENFSSDSPHFHRVELQRKLAGQLEFSLTQKPADLAVLSEYSRIERISLEALRSFGASKWKFHNDQLTEMKSKIEKEIEEKKNEIEKINRKRKGEQLMARSGLDLIESKFQESIQKNYSIEGECRKIQAKLKEMKKIAIERGMENSKIQRLFGEEIEE